MGAKNIKPQTDHHKMHSTSMDISSFSSLDAHIFIFNVAKVQNALIEVFL